MRFLDNDTARSLGDIPHIEEIKFSHCALFIGTKGWVAVSRGAWQVFPNSLLKVAKNPGPKKVIHSINHQHNFVDAVLARKQPISDLDSAIQSDLICHLSNISIRTGRTIRWDPKKETIVGNRKAAKMMKRPLREPWTL